MLRGPQGTLFGRNATGGLIQVTSRKPTDTLDGYVQASYGNYNHANSEAAIGNKIAENLSGRIAISFNKQDGTYQNSLGPNFGGDDTVNSRAQLQYEFTTGAKNLLEGFVSRSFPVYAGAYIPYAIAPNSANHGLSEINSGSLFAANCAALGYTVAAGATNCFGYVRHAGGNPWSLATPYVGTFNRTLYGATNTFTSTVGSMNFVSISNYTAIKKYYVEDDSGGPDPVVGYAQGYGPGNGVSAHQISEEVRLSGSSSRIDWVAGLYALKIKGNYSLELLYGSIFDPYLVVGSRFDQDVRSLAAFGQIDYKLSDAISLIAGLRGNNDYKSVQVDGFCNSDPATCALYGSGPDGANFAGSNSHNDWSGRLQLTYKFNATSMVYAGVNRGNKAGEVTIPTGAPLPGTTFASQFVKPEVLTAYETGFKTSWLQERLRLNGDVFYYDYSNIQAYKSVGVSSVIFNAQARNYGAEFEVSARPMRFTTLSGGLALLQTKIEGVSLPDGTVANQQQAFAPHVSANVSARQELPISSGMLFVQTDVNHSSSYYGSTVNETATMMPSHTVVGLSGGWIDVQEKTRVVVLVTNLTNSAYPIGRYDYAPVGGYGEENLAPPRMVNVSVSRKF